MSRAPIIVIGAHRSGTSALSRILDGLGLFVGSRLDPNHEALFFLRLNDWLLEQCGGRWDHPDVIDDLLADAEVRPLVVDYLRLAVDSPRSLAYLGARKFVGARRLSALSIPWGFKDPRSTFTLPVWREVFPQARIVHIHRHGVDVAQSLVRRHRAHLAHNRRGFERNRRLLAVWAKRAGFGESVRCRTLEGALGLWEDYVLRARQHVRAMGDRALELRFEDLARDPETAIRQLATFCELDLDAARLARAAALMSPDRAGAHAADAELSEFAERHAARIARVRGDAALTADPHA